jgi:hypothetical protein
MPAAAAHRRLRSATRLDELVAVCQMAVKSRSTRMLIEAEVAECISSLEMRCSETIIFRGAYGKPKQRRRERGPERGTRTAELINRVVRRSVRGSK